MVQINLLPVAAKKKRKGRVELKISLAPFLYSLTGIIVIIILAWAILGMRLKTQHQQIARQDRELTTLELTIQKLDQLKANKADVLQKLEFLQQTIKREVPWAQNLNQLSELLPEGIWLKKLTLHTIKEDDISKYEKLNISAAAISVQPDEMIGLIGGFISALKKDELFAEQFAEIELISSKTSKAGRANDIELMDFELFCQFRSQDAEH